MMENKTKIDLKNKSIFITGVAGFIGSNLAKRLLSTVEGVKVVGLDNMNNYYDVRLKEARLKELEQFEKFSFVKGNLADKAVIESIFEQYKPEIVVNLGAQAGVRYSITNPDAYVEANLIGFYWARKISQNCPRTSSGNSGNASGCRRHSSACSDRWRSSRWMTERSRNKIAQSEKYPLGQKRPGGLGLTGGAYGTQKDACLWREGTRRQIHSG